jgi:hypothetical protein
MCYRMDSEPADEESAAALVLREQSRSIACTLMC